MLRKTLALLLALCTLAYAQGNTFTKVRYNGGTVSTKVDPKDWDNTLTVTSDDISLKLKDGQQVEIKPKLVTSLSYGQEAHRRVGTMIALGILVAPIALFGLFHKTRLHFIGIEYTTPEGKKGGLLMQGDKGNYRAILVALQSVTGVPVAVAEKEREFIPVGVTTSVAKESSGSEASRAASQTASTATVGTVRVTSTPDGAELYSDGGFVGNTPSTLKLSAGKHVIKVTAAGHKEWSREITVQAGAELSLNAVLETQ
jgi:hypothetical protein